MACPCPTTHCFMCRVLPWSRAIASFCALRRVIPSSTASRRDAFSRVWRRVPLRRSNPEPMKERCVWSFIRGCLALCLICLAGCQQEMANEPRYKPLAASTFFADGRASRDLVSGTVARGHAPREGPLDTGRVGAEEVTDLPLPLTPALLARGRERYNIYCTPCHDHVGTGHGVIVQRGYPHP